MLLLLLMLLLLRRQQVASTHDTQFCAVSRQSHAMQTTSGVLSL